MISLTEKEIKNFEKFRNELTRISKKYGIALKSIGGVMVGDIKEIECSDDHTSGDLYPRVIEWDEEEEI